MVHTTCPSCNGEQIDVFYSIKNAPVFSMVTLKSKEEALAVPRKDIELAFCNDCGFIFNRLFDTNINYFTEGYEDQQGYSETFMKFLTKISKELIEKYNLAGKTCLEIGCGKGDFLNLFTELTNGKGIGVDPAYEDGRQTNPNLEFYKEFYSVKHGKLPVDFVCCRHTLEHIFHTKKFLQLLRNSLGSNSETVVFFEVPQIKRILDIQAFWDIYYEHCSYFSLVSLANVFRSAGFEILDLKLAYDDQYILIEAKPVHTISKKTFELEETIEELKRSVNVFKVKIEEQLNFWRQKLISLRKHDKKTIVWGGGSKSVGFLTNFADIGLIEYVVDINPHMEGNFIPGIGIMYVQPKFLKKYKPDIIIIMNRIYRDEIAKTLSDMGIFPEFYTL